MGEHATLAPNVSLKRDAPVGARTQIGEPRLPVGRSYGPAPRRAVSDRPRAVTASDYGLQPGQPSLPSHGGRRDVVIGN